MSGTNFGKYKLLLKLGHGGMGDVFLAAQSGPAGSGIRKLSVVKRLRPNLAEEPEFVTMLVDEARIAARLNHPNVVQTIDVDRCDGSYFIAMEYLDGQPLDRIQQRSAVRAGDGSPPLFGTELTYVVLMDVLAGLHHAHELLDYDGAHLAIIHRDVTPHNVFVTYDGQVKVVDFGLAKAARRISDDTAQGIIKGKFRYMAPEQVVGRDVDHRVDLFAVGIMLWEAATRKRIWKNKDNIEIIRALVAGEIPRSPRAVVPTVPIAIDAMCQRALAQRPEDRHPTADAFRAELEEYLIESGILPHARRQIPAALDELFADRRAEIRQLIDRQLANVDTTSGGDFAALSLPPGDTMPPSVEPARRSTSRVVVAAFAALFVTLLGLIAILATMRNESSPTTTQPADVTISVSAIPSTARVSIDDGPLEGVPVAKRVRRDDNFHTIRVVADGYETKTDLVRYSQDVLLSFDLLKHVDEPATTTTVAPDSGAKSPPAGPRVRSPRQRPR